MSQPLGGTVDVAGKCIRFGELSLAEEWKLGTLLVQQYVKDKGTAYSRCKAMLDAMDPRDRATAVAEITRSEVAGELPGPEAKGIARLTPKGVALELWMRARKFHPDLRLEELELIINDVNCLDVLGEMIRLLTPEDKDSSKS